MGATIVKPLRHIKNATTHGIVRTTYEARKANDDEPCPNYMIRTETFPGCCRRDPGFA